MKKVLCMLFIVIFIFTLGGCAKIINTEIEVVEATIIDVDRDPMMKIGSTFRPADYDILIKYNDVETWIDVSRREYNEYKKIIGTTIEVNLVTNYYEDNTIKQYLKLIQ